MESDGLEGLLEVEPGLFPDTHEVRMAIRRAKKKYRRVWLPGSGEGEGGGGARPLLMIVDDQAEYLNMATMKSALLVDPRDPASEFLVGEELLADEDACAVTPAWVLGQTRLAVARAREEAAAREAGRELATLGRAPRVAPVRCTYVRVDGRRCFAWSPMKRGAVGMCQVHTLMEGKDNAERTGAATAREILLQAAPAAASELEALALEAVSEPVRLKASTEILDRVGVRGGSELSVDARLEVVDPAEQVRVRLEQLAKRLIAAPAAATEVVDAEVEE